MGLCLFGADGRVTATEGAADVWAPAVGAMIDDANLFVGMRETFEGLRAGGGSFLLSGVSIGSGDGRALDVRILWVADLEIFAAVSGTATERNQLQFEVSQFIRDNRLLEERVRKQSEKIAEQAEMMALFIRHVPAAVAMLDSNLDPMMLSQRWIEEFGDPSPGADSGVSGSPLDMPRIGAALRLAMDNGVTSSRVERISQRGAVVWKRWEQTPWRRADRGVGGTILYFEDVTDQIGKTARLRSQSGEIQKINAELRVIGRAVTEDLLGPLRRIEAIARADADSAAGLAEIAARAARMSGMIGALKRYIRTSSRDFILAPFDLGDAVESAAAGLRQRIEAAGARIILRQMLVISGDLPLMARVFHCLIDNALKHAGGAPIITIDCHDEDGMAIVSVTDDGPGIAVHLHNRAFELFSRLDADAAGSGAGMGLAECRKIVELHGGTLVIDPGYELGLRVLINLPQHQAARGPSQAPE